jgi:hypothetical protein
MFYQLGLSLASPLKAYEIICALLRSEAVGEGVKDIIRCLVVLVLISF